MSKSNRFLSQLRNEFPDVEVFKKAPPTFQDLQTLRAEAEANAYMAELAEAFYQNDRLPRVLRMAEAELRREAERVRFELGGTDYQNLLDDLYEMGNNVNKAVGAYAPSLYEQSKMMMTVATLLTDLEGDN